MRGEHVVALGLIALVRSRPHRPPRLESPILAAMSSPSLRDHALYGSRAEDPLTLVDEEGRTLGSATLADMHRPPGKLHRAFSAYLFDADDRLLVHQRHSSKALWGSFWSNSCCSHPYDGEAIDAAAVRRVRQELGPDLPLYEMFSYVYRAEFLHLGVEHEFVHVFAGRVDPAVISPAEKEVEEIRWLDAEGVDSLIAGEDQTTPWFEMAWPRVRAAFANHLPDPPPPPA